MGQGEGDRGGGLERERERRREMPLVEDQLRILPPRVYVCGSLRMGVCREWKVPRLCVSLFARTQTRPASLSLTHTLTLLPTIPPLCFSLKHTPRPAYHCPPNPLVLLPNPLNFLLYPYPSCMRDAPTNPPPVRLHYTSHTITYVFTLTRIVNRGSIERRWTLRTKSAYRIRCCA